MNSNPSELTIENSAVVLIDHQPWVAVGVRSIDLRFLMKNVAGLAQAARDLGVPTVLTTVGAEGSILVDPIFTEISEVFPDLKPIDRTTTHAWSHPAVREAVEATGRKKLIMAGIVTESCLAQSVLGALKDGFDVYFVSDCSGGLTTESHEDAKARMMQAGAKPISWAGVITEWGPDYMTPKGPIRAKVFEHAGGMLKLQVDYPMAQVEAGLVQLPESLAAFAPTRGRAG